MKGTKRLDAFFDALPRRPLQRLAMADAVVAGGQPKIAPPWFRRNLRNDIIRSMRISGIGDDYIQIADLKEGAVPDLNTVGPQRMPSPTVWIELHSTDGRIGIAALLEELDPEERGQYAYAITTYGSGPKGSVVVGNFHAYVITDESGEVTDFRSRNTLQGVDSVESLSPGRLADFVHFMRVIGLVNCKNVGTQRHERPTLKPRSSNPKLRKSPAQLDYHTIVLPGSPSGGGSSQGLDVMPLHKVRGHFKTFTADKPLMGQHVGTYWWGWQVRGNKKNGITVTDYRMDAS